MLSSPDRDDDLLQERLRALHDAWPGDPADDDPLRATRRAVGAPDPDRDAASRRPGPVRTACRTVRRAILRRLGASAAGLPLPPVAEGPSTAGPPRTPEPQRTPLPRRTPHPPPDEDPATSRP
ncbi:hypothetical protein [Clavibacter michiganensis]|uniref:Uncharacterized protein n=1 Tax=Clavibacter michiganensis TaxID=28447 RepID=A0A251YIP6_9MICO|nr:hypothetical protein [Clavibacter michiganensis]OUE24121.1 hypothetical protein BFL37_09445 [Clavibacter michiganensis]